MSLRAACAASLTFVASLAITTPEAQASHRFQVLYNFSSKADGGNPHGSLLRGSDGNLYGTTVQGGSGGYGVVFRLSPDGTETPLYSFSGGDDGHYAYGGLVQDKRANLFGVTLLGGAYGEGNIFRLNANGKLTVLHAFAGRPDGSTPEEAPIMDESGNLFGTTPYGGYGPGTVYKLAPDGTETILHNFADGQNDGAYPYGGVAMDARGNLYGTTNDGGSGGLQQGPGILYKLTASGKFSVLHRFESSTGDYPAAAPILDASGNLYGTTSAGGDGSVGVVYKFAHGTYTVLHSFMGGEDGEYGIGRLAMDGSGSLYGVTTGGGGACDCGTVFKLAPDGTYSVLHRFAGSDGREPSDGLIMDKRGNLFGTAYEGGKNNAGVVFEIRN